MADNYDVKLDINRCGLCGKAFVAAAGASGVCDDCKREEQELYNRVRALIRDNPDRVLHVDEAASLLRVSEHKIRYLVSRGLVQLVTGSSLR